jgi:16S rRNA (uracil1498-N3)-methyltransferase
MYHFFAEHKDIHVPEGRILLSGADYNHIRNVLRMRPGEQLLISSGDNFDYLCAISGYEEDASGQQTVVCRILKTDVRTSELPLHVTLYQGLPKGDKMDLIVQKCIELGVERIVPVAMRRSVVKLDERKSQAKVTRWNAIAEAAANQSKRSRIPEVTPVMRFEEAAAQAAKASLFLLPYESAEGMRYTREVLGSLNPGDTVSVFIGPEGGFSPEEVGFSREKGAKIVTLGRRILRTETAGMMILSILTYLYEDDEEEEKEDK